MSAEDKRRYSVTLSNAYEKSLDSLIKKGLYIDHQDVIRAALRHLFQHHEEEAFSLKMIDAGSDFP